VSLSHTLQLHIEQLREIRSILKAMKNLAFMELHKLKGGTDRQSEVVAHLEQVALDFLYYYPLPVEEGVTFLSIGVLLGAERGFCGDFNESLLKSIVNQDFKQVITIGNRLCNLLDEATLESDIQLAGANVIEEVPGVIQHLVEVIQSLLESQHARQGLLKLKLTLVYHDNATHQIEQHQLLPAFSRWLAVEVISDDNISERSDAFNIGQADDSTRFDPSVIRRGSTIRQGETSSRSNPVTLNENRLIPLGGEPLLNVAPNEFYTDLLEHYLISALHEIFYSSLAAENQSRLQHLEAALKYMDDETDKLQRKSQSYRQEEITEEIEVILLNSAVE